MVIIGRRDVMRLCSTGIARAIAWGMEASKKAVTYDRSMMGSKTSGD